MEIYMGPVHQPDWKPQILGIDKDFGNITAGTKRNRLSPLKIGKKGNLVEWYGDWGMKIRTTGMYHICLRYIRGAKYHHYWIRRGPVAEHLEVRGDGGTGWSKAWKINFWARLLDGNHAYKMYQELLKGSTLNNLLIHPPFQIDGTFRCNGWYCWNAAAKSFGRDPVVARVAG